MCEFISYLEIGDKILFLTPKDIESKYGKQALKDSKDNDFLGHNSIRAFYGLKDGAGKNKENKDFWNGDLPQEIKDAWNNGELDGMFKYFQSDDIVYILLRAPVDFIKWALKCRGETFESMKKDRHYLNRLIAYLVAQDYEALKKDGDYYNRQIAYLVTKDYEAMKKDGYYVNRQIACLVTRDYKAMKKDDAEDNRLIAYLAAQDYRALKKDGYYYNRQIAYLATKDYEAMKKDDAEDNRLIAFLVTQDYEAMKKDGYYVNRQIAYLAAGKKESAKRPKL